MSASLRRLTRPLVAAVALACGAPCLHAQALGISGGNTHPKAFGLHITPGNSNADQGRFIAFGGEHDQLHVSCASCHGLDGTGDPSGAFPRLAQQDASYLYRSLRDFASGARVSPVMTPIAQELTDRAMRDVSAYYSSVGPQPYPPSSAADAQADAAGRKIAEHGAKGEPACESCHGAQARGVRNAYPYLAGQYASYLESQLRAFKRNERRGSPAAVMHGIASALSGKQIREVSRYLASLRPREQATADRKLLHRVGAHAHPLIELARGATETDADVGARPR